MTTVEQLEIAVSRLIESALKVKAERDKFRDALAQVRDLIEGYVDITDGDYGQPRANKAMRAVQVIDEVL